MKKLKKYLHLLKIIKINLILNNMTKEDLKNYIRIEDELKHLCSRWAEKHLEDWQYYSGYDIKDDFIIINYTYSDFWHNTDTYTEWDSVKVSIDDIINQ